MSEALDRSSHRPDDGTKAINGAENPATTRAATPLCFLVDEDFSIRHFLSLVLHGAGVDSMEFADGAALRHARAPRAPDLIFHNVSLESADAIESIVALGKNGYRGAVQLMSNRGAAVLDHVKTIGTQHKLTMLPVLKKPFAADAIIKIVQDLKLGKPAPTAVKIGLAEALTNNWIEFWYQPKIDLRKKQLAGAEAFARVRHPQHGTVMPGAFMPGASEADVLKLSELAVVNAIKAGLKFSELGINLRIAVNVPVPVLVKLSIPDLVKAHCSPNGKWPGLMIDVTEDQIITDIALAKDLTKKFEPCNVKLAVDDFGHSYAALVRIKELPFAELKLDRAFVTDCSTDKVNAPLCRTVIELAHNFGSVAVAVGIEKAADAIALVTMGCDYGQGFLLGQPMPEEHFTSLLRQRAGTPEARAPADRMAEKQSA
jgi:EAL domain-containing protein (putative c-di-GMP-specific phosphodiesterase class I)